MKKHTMMGVSLLLASAPVLAEDGIKSSVEVGLLLTEGNADTRSVNIKGNTEYTKGKSRNTLNAEVLYVDGDSGKLSEKYVGAGKTAYQFGKHSYAFLNGTLERDLFSGYDYQGTISAGYGYRFIDSKEMIFDLEAGPGYRRVKLDAEEAEGEVIARVSGKFLYQISKTSAFTEELVSDIGSDTVITKSVTAVTAQIVGNMSMKASLTIKNNSKPPAEADKTDAEVGLTLVYSF